MIVTVPPHRIFTNCSSGRRHAAFIAKTLEDRIKNGSIEVVGKVGEVAPPKVVMCICVEPTKPRLCHDE